MTRLPEPLSLSCADGSGSVLSYGAHVVSWAPEDHEPVLWVSSRSYNETGRAVRGGVPICFPWFGPGRTGDMDPAHGFARITEWQLAEQGEDTEGHAYAEFTLTPADVAEHLRETFPHEFEARFRVTVGARLRMALTVTNTGTGTFDFEEALHSYLHVGDSRRVSVTGLDGVSYYDKVAKEQRRQSGELAITGETDAVFAHRGEERLSDPGPARRRRVTHPRAKHRGAGAHGAGSRRPRRLSRRPSPTTPERALATQRRWRPARAPLGPARTPRGTPRCGNAPGRKPRGAGPSVALG